MNPKEQATKQSLDTFTQITNSLNRYFTDPSEQGKINLPKIPEQSFYKEPSRLVNFLLESTVGNVLNLPRNFQIGSKQLGTGIGQAIQGQPGATEEIMRGSGRLIGAGIDVLSMTPIGPIAKLGQISATAPTLGKAIIAGAKEAGIYGTGYGLSEGLMKAAEQPSEQRLKTITESTLTGGLLGGAFGAATPPALAGIKKTYRYFFPENLLNVTRPLDDKLSSIVKKNEITKYETLKEEPVVTAGKLPEVEVPTPQPTKKLRAALPYIKKDITEGNAVAKQVGKDVVSTAITSAENSGNKIASVSSFIKSKAEDIITNLQAGNKDGAIEIAQNLDIEEYGKTKKFLISLRDKGNLPENTKKDIDDFINTSLESKYTPRESKKEYDAVKTTVEEMTNEERRTFAKSILDIVARVNQYVFNNGIAPSDRPRLTQEAIYQAYPKTSEMFNLYGNIEEFIDALGAKLATEGDNQLAKQLFNTSSSIRTASGQTIESAKRSLQGQIDQANEALNILRGKKDSKLNQQINTATQEITDEFTQQLNTFIDSGATQKEVAKFVNEFMIEKFGKDWDKATKPLLLKELAPDTVARRVEDLVKRIPKNAAERKEQDVIDAMVKQLFLIAKDEINAPIKAGQPDDIFNILKLALKNKGKYKQTWEKAKQRVMETFKNDPEALGILQDYFARNVPSVFKETQAQRAYRKLIKEDGVRFNDLVKEHFTSQIEKREDLVLKLQAKLGISQADAADLSSRIYSYFNTNLEKSRKAAIDRIITPIVRNQGKKKELIDKLIEYSNLGIFNNTDYANIVASKLNLPHLTDENTQFIAKTMDRLQRGEIDMETALKDIAMNISKANKLDPIRNVGDFNIFMNSYFYNNIFSSFQTWERNLLGGLVNAFVVRPAIIAGERIASSIFKTIGKELPEGIKSLPKGELGQYYKQLFGNIGNASNRFFEVIRDPNYIARTDNPTVRYYFDKGRENQLPKILTTIGRFMEALDQFNATLITAAEENLMRNRGFSPEQARQKAFVTSQELLGRASFGKGLKKGDIIGERVKQEGWIDPFFDTIGNKGYELRASGRFSNFATTAIFPVIRIAINLQKLKTKLFLPTQLLDVLLKDPSNRKLQDYGYLVASSFTTAFAIDKMMKGEVEFEAPRDEKAKQLFYDAGKKPYSVKIGNTYVPFQYLEVFGAPFLAMGAIKAAFQDNPDALTQSVIEKTGTAINKFVIAYLVSPTYLSTIANIIDAWRGINGKSWGQALAYPSTGLIPFSGLLRDLSDIIDPIRRKKESGWDEYKSVFGPLRQGLEPFRDVNLKPVELNATELYAPYGIGFANSQREQEYNKRIQEVQQGKAFTKQLEPEKQRIDAAKTELEMALRAKNNKYAAEIIRKQKLTPDEVSSITNKLKEEQAKAKLTPQELGLYNLSGRQLELLGKQNPELLPLINKVSSYKQDFVSPSQNLFQSLQEINKGPSKKKISVKGRRRRSGGARVKKIRSRKIRVSSAKQPKIKKLRAIKSPQI